MKYTTQELITVIVAAVVGIAFLAVIVMPAFGVTPDPQVQATVLAAFFGLAGLGGGMAYKQKEVAAAELKAEAAEYVVANLRGRDA